MGAFIADRQEAIAVGDNVRKRGGHGADVRATSRADNNVVDCLQGQLPKN